MLVKCNGKEGMREAGGRRFESQVMQVCIFRQKNRSLTLYMASRGGWLEYFLFCCFRLLGGFFIFWTRICRGRP